MKKSLLKFTAPALAIGLTVSAQGSVLAASPHADVNAKAEVKVEQGKAFKGGADVSHRLNPVEKRISKATSQVSEITSELKDAEALSYEEYLKYQEQINAVFGTLGASTNQLEAVTKKFDDNASEIIAVKLDLNSAFESAVETQSLLESIDVIEEVPEVEVPDVEEPVVEVPVEEPGEEPAEDLVNS
ncbi:hypothetical protein ACSFXN_06850 [Planococcus sp. 1R117A]|uniref:hypothetical protein n=1 Tax=Planococcus sp. 1R117A TaxID=3447020 RepID=UPI003EDB71F0